VTVSLKGPVWQIPLCRLLSVLMWSLGGVAEAQGVLEGLFWARGIQTRRTGGSDVPKLE
jgi:hypothetical protein